MGDYGENDRYFATSFAAPEHAELLRQAIAENNPLLPLIERASSHICALQDKIQYCRSRGGYCDCACACDYDDPGDVCMPHAKAKTQPTDGTDE